MAPDQPADTSALCAELLLAYQSSVVHDLRGDLNGLLLTLDFLRRQMASRPETASLFGESLGDMDHVRSSLTRTLNQLEAVGHARRVVGGRETPSPLEQNLATVIGDVVQLLGDRIRRRNVSISLPPERDVVIRVDPVLFHLTLHRILAALVDLSKNGEIRISVSGQPGGPATVRVSVLDARLIPADLVGRAMNIDAVPAPVPHAVAAIALAMRLAEQLGGSLRREASGEENTFTLVLELPAGA
jgi:K+-sensing histidine kinase KdpD